MSKKLLCSIVGCVALVSAQALAAPLLPGTSANAAGEPDPVGASIVAGPLVSNLVGVAFTGTLTSTVYSNDATNPLGGLTFVYEVANSPNSADPIGRFTVNSYAGFGTDVSWQLGGGLPPTFQDRTPNGDVVGFSFLAPPVGPGVLVPGATSARLVIQTDAPRFEDATGFAINGSIASAPSYGPVPEPATLLFLAGGAGLILRRRR